jgi:hypothetical protein
MGLSGIGMTVYQPLMWGKWIRENCPANAVCISIPGILKDVTARSGVPIRSWPIRSWPFVLGIFVSDGPDLGEST